MLKGAQHCTKAQVDQLCYASLQCSLAWSSDHVQMFYAFDNANCHSAKIQCLSIIFQILFVGEKRLFSRAIFQTQDRIKHMQSF